jgi:hypothetical protein
LKRPLLLA